MEAWLRAFEAKMYKDNPDIGILNMLAMAACYSPDANAPLGLALPFDLETCTLDEAIWAKWRAYDPVEMVARYVDGLRQLRLLYFDWGAGDEFFLYYGARAASNANCKCSISRTNVKSLTAAISTLTIAMMFLFPSWWPR